MMDGKYQVSRIYSVEGKVAVVTGGASGIGLAVAEALVDNGCKVWVIDLDQGAIDAAVAHLGPRASGQAADIASAPSISAAINHVDETEGGIDIVFANAGIGGDRGYGAAEEGQNPAGTIDGCPDEEWQKVLDVNLTGVRNTLGAAARVMKARNRGGSIIITSSCAGLINVPFVSTAYHATKAAATHLGRQVAAELAPFGIRVNIMSPASFVTGIGGGSMQHDFVKDMFAKTTLLGRVAHTDEILGVALLLASDASSYMTGIDIPIDGGALIAGRYG